MCIIIDDNRFGDFFNPNHQDSQPIREWLDKKWGFLVYSTGGNFPTMIERSKREKLLEYARSGHAKLIPSCSFRDEEYNLEKSGKLRSDDPHILALARKSNARLLYTHDADLIKDFKDPLIITGPRGAIYSRAENADLLTRDTCQKLLPNQ